MGGATRGVGDFNGFRDRMLSDGHLASLVDFPDSREVFPGVSITGGVCYFLWDSSYSGETRVTTMREGDASTALRKLNEFDVFVRDHMAVKILKKVQSKQEKSIIDILTADTPFGISSNFTGHRAVKRKGDIALYFSKKGKRDVGFIERDSISKNAGLIDKWKVLTPSGHDGGQKIPYIVLGKPWICPPPAASTQTFLAFFVESEDEAKSLETYYRTKFFRFLVSIRKMTQNGFRSTYAFVPQQIWDQEWNDSKLYKKYGLTKEEIDYIELMIRPMDNLNEGELDG
jgi:site-specific DNA-methyltransferase (adenine-specific)